MAVATVVQIGIVDYILWYLLKRININNLTNMKYLFCIFFLFCIYNCANNKNKNNNNGNIISFDVNSKSDVNLSNIILNCKYIKLESTNNSLIGELFKIQIIKNKIFILDSRKSMALFVFDMDGKFLFKINNLGKAPGQFIHPCDFVIDTISNHIIVADSGQRKLIYYDAEGNYDYQIKTKFFFNSFALHKNCLFFDLVNNQYDGQTKTVIVTNLKGDILTNLIPFNEKIKGLGITSTYPFNFINDTLLFLPAMSNKIYSLSETKAEINYIIDFGINWPTPDLLDMRNVKNVMYIIQKLNSSNYVAFLNCIATDKVLCFHYYIHGEKQLAFYYKQSNKLIIVDKFIDDIGCGGFQVPVGSYNNNFIGLLQIENIKEKILNQKNEKALCPQITNIIKDSKDGDNPVLLLLNIK